MTHRTGRGGGGGGVPGPGPVARRRPGSSPTRSLPAAAVLLLVGGATLLATFPRPAAAQGSSVGCALCHGELELLRQQVPTLEDARGLLVTAAELRGSAHDSLSCGSCHAGFGRFPHPDGAGSTRRCVDCHEQSIDPWRAGVHGRPTNPSGDQAAETSVGASCSACHGVHDVQPIPAAEEDGGLRSLDRACVGCHPTAALPPSDPHAEAVSCAACHEPHRTRSMEDPQGSLAPGAQAATCGACHADAGRDAPGDAHGTALAALEGTQGIAGFGLAPGAPPTCTSCHGAHGMRAPSHEGFDREMVAECGACHEGHADTYFGTYHGKATALGSEIAATCDHCHGSHRVFPSLDARSAVSGERLVGTCGACHEQSRPAFVLYDSHPDPLDRGRNGPLFWSFVFMNVLLFGVLGVFTLHTVLWWVRLMLDRRKERRTPPTGGHGV